MTPYTVNQFDYSSDETIFVASRRTEKQPANSAKGAATTLLSQNQVKHVTRGTGAAYWGPGELMTFLITGEETGGAFFMVEVSVVPGGDAPPHIHHREDESFHLLEGMLTMQVGEDTIAASAGDFVFLPREIAHSFKNTGDSYAKALVVTVPAGLEGFFWKCSSQPWIVPRRRRLPAMS